MFLSGDVFVRGCFCPGMFWSVADIVISHHCHYCTCFNYFFCRPTVNKDYDYSVAVANICT